MRTKFKSDGKKEIKRMEQKGRNETIEAVFTA